MWRWKGQWMHLHLCHCSFRRRANLICHLRAPLSINWMSLQLARANSHFRIVIWGSSLRWDRINFIHGLFLIFEFRIKKLKATHFRGSKLIRWIESDTRITIRDQKFHYRDPLHIVGCPHFSFLSLNGKVLKTLLTANTIRSVKSDSKFKSALVSKIRITSKFFCNYNRTCMCYMYITF